MLKAIHNNVILQKKSVSSKNGIYMPNTDNDIYVVLHVGEEVSTVRSGQTVITKENPKKVMMGFEEYYICIVENIMAIVEEENE